MPSIYGEEIADINTMAEQAQEILWDDVVFYLCSDDTDENFKKAIKHPVTRRFYTDAKAAFGDEGIQVVDDILQDLCANRAADMPRIWAEDDALHAACRR